MLYVVPACDYGRLPEDLSKQDGQTAGPHTLARLNAALLDVFNRVDDRQVAFVVAAGHLDQKHRRLNEVQAEYLRKQWKSDRQPELIIFQPALDEQVWGTKGEFLFAKKIIARLEAQGDSVETILVNEDYVSRRSRFLAWKVGLRYDRSIWVDSRHAPPTEAELWHEIKSLLGHLVLPEWVATHLAKREAVRVSRRHGL